MYKVIDEEKKEHFYDNIQLITSVADITPNAQYVLVQEDGAIVIWKVAETNVGCAFFPGPAVNDLVKYYKKHKDRNFDTMIKKLISL